MNMIIIMCVLILALATVVMMLASILAKTNMFDRETPTPFECGFDPMSSARLPFSLRFFLIAIIFLVFDVEIALVMPVINILKTTKIMSWAFTSITFIIILIWGTIHEWKQGSLEWS